MGREIADPPRIFSVNWFRKDEQGKFSWPGFGDNMRVLRWVVERANGSALGHESPLGWMPRYEDLDWRGLASFTAEQFADSMSVDPALWKKELLSHEELFVELYDRLPAELESVRNLIMSGLWRLRENWEIEDPSLGS
jgi:phosphoenolpyruvate carboxykinase (GTP)